MGNVIAEKAVCVVIKAAMSSWSPPSCLDNIYADGAVGIPAKRIAIVNGGPVIPKMKPQKAVSPGFITSFVALVMLIGNNLRAFDLTCSPAPTAKSPKGKAALPSKSRTCSSGRGMEIDNMLIRNPAIQARIRGFLITSLLIYERLTCFDFEYPTIVGTERRLTKGIIPIRATAAIARP